MKNNRFLLKVGNDLTFWPAIEAFYEKLCDLVDFPDPDKEDLKEALRELYENAVIHAYKDEEGEIEIVFELYDNALTIEVHDWGEPIDPALVKAVPLDKKEKGFNRVYQLTDEFRYINLGLEGKKFVIAKYLPFHLKLNKETHYYSDISDDFEAVDKEQLQKRLIVRTFEPGDEIWIPKLIYRNYGYTYFKDLFYYPEKILQKEQSGQILSIVAEIEGKIVGHFALVKLPNSNIAEIGIAVVDPAYKGMGIMKRMFELLIQKAIELDLDALFGEAVTFHPYSQRANARFGFCTTALLLGEVHHIVRLKDHKYPFSQKRGAVAVEYKLLKKWPRELYIPKIYHSIITKTYDNCQVPYHQASVISRSTHLDLEYNPSFAIATIVIDAGGEEFKKEFKKLFDAAVAKHPDMIYADLNLHTLHNIDEIVDELREYGFFYAGVEFLRRKDQDYLRLQFEAAENIEEENIVCYSDFCKELHRFILEDKASVYKEI
ncbi:MAG: hypothetical protein C6H99_03615 [Epsilonproteobacteria bacterium]|nr:hypothetical protein [Campylobacterota bacterium]NPA64561.1 GNAT family N-acetyltransferase [Campylobacterota bacterium]